MDSEEIPTGLELQLSVINSLFNEFDFITSPDIAEGMVCDLECCIAHGIPWYTEILMKCHDDEPDSSILSTAELNILNQLTEELSRTLRYFYENGEEGFSTTEQWIKFVSLTKAANIILKDAVKRYQATANITK